MVTADNEGVKMHKQGGGGTAAAQAMKDRDYDRVMVHACVPGALLSGVRQLAYTTRHEGGALGAL